MVHSGLLVCSFFIKERYGRDDSKAIELNKSITIEGIENTEHYQNIFNGSKYKSKNLVLKEVINNNDF